MKKLCGLLALGLSINACTAADSPEESQTGKNDAPTWEQFQANPPVTWLAFRASAKSVPESPSTFIVDGDIAVHGEGQLREFYDRWLKQEYETRLGRDSALTVYNILGADVLWPSPQKLQLSYCVSDTFGTRKAALVEALGRATKSWSDRVDVQFNYVPTQDASCNATNTNVVFDVVPSSASFFASSFFPNQARGERELFVTEAAFTTTDGGRDLEGIMRHELGHTLGFRHEHIHITCTGETTSDSRQVTAYDVNSVMHYPQCRPSTTGGYRQTELDYQGAVLLYGAPPYPAGGGVTGDFDGDGYADVMTMYQYPNGTAALFVFPGTAASGDTAAPPYMAWSSGSAFYAQSMLVAAGDFNGDGLTDVLGLYDYGAGSAGLFVFPGSTTHVSTPFRAWHVTSGFDVRKAKLTAGKYDADNYADALVVYDNGGSSASLIKFPGSTSTTTDAATSKVTVWTSAAGGFDATRAKLTMGDFNRDGKADVVVLEDYSNVYGANTGGVWVFPSAPGASSPAPYQIWSGSVDYQHAQVAGGDFDGDGYRDLMVFTDLGASGKLQIFPSSTSAVTPYTIWSAPSSAFKVSYTKITGGDFNHDGKDDLLQLYDYGPTAGIGAAGLFVLPGTTSHVENAVSGYRVWYAGPGSFEVGRARVP